MKFANRLKRFFGERCAQVSLEYILLVGGVLTAAIVIVGVHRSLRELANTTESWIEVERNRTISELLG